MKIKQSELREDINKVLANFGKMVKETRQLKKWSTTKLAEESGISQSLISDLENNKGKVPNIYTLVAIARALDLPDETFVEQIWKNINKKSNSEQKNEFLLEKALREYGVPIESLNDIIIYIKYLVFMKDINKKFKQDNVKISKDIDIILKEHLIEYLKKQNIK